MATAAVPLLRWREGGAPDCDSAQNELNEAHQGPWLLAANHGNEVVQYDTVFLHLCIVAFGGSNLDWGFYFELDSQDDFVLGPDPVGGRVAV